MLFFLLCKLIEICSFTIAIYCYFKNELGQAKKIISFSGQFPKILMRLGGTFFLSVIISAVAAYTGNNHACLWHKRFTDNDRDQQTYGSDQSGSGNDRKRTQLFFSQCKNDQCGSKNTHAAVPEKLTINFFWPYKCFFLILFYMFFVLIFQVSAGC